MRDAKDVRISREAYAPHPLANIVNDLWGHAAPANAAGPSTTQAVPAQSFPPFEQLWQVADETVDWTEALVREHPADGLTSETLWQFFHENAQAVLDGDVQAYMTVLKAANPLGDLKSYARAYTVRATDADELTCDFEVDPAYLSSTESEVRRYLCGVSLRVARDLMALLPVSRVTVHARQDENSLLDVTYPRETLQRVRFSFVDPVALTKECQE